ncbi:hypothetical protein AVEN_200412-1 [Araneus ventricosus]|uniref:PiggyBac transposable element-derived protein domain-containing protein n=1 Tax=Araneus ventricosus TaxID=182803 RepID=A0A4Y2K182_ARAVE|nr:hypothetical protein AVEN_240029-1 [Araneus ventricosus]GBM96120.1 hypothetical protein AVEN_28819-1 [Araneus ventricosus]GBM96137.1 hypothetical protein AVEN_129101-1 [Araneus ventricosus]GBM96160.1 hypothetical protein AVEN_200412-1 [Araneus ventricosus]
MTAYERQQHLASVPTDCENDDSSDSSDIDETLESVHCIELEQDAEDSDLNDEAISDTFYIDINGTNLKKISPRKNSRTKSSNIVSHLSSIMIPFKSISSILAFF